MNVSSGAGKTDGKLSCIFDQAGWKHLKEVVKVEVEETLEMANVFAVGEEERH